jgi:putative NADH-flavin reductase
MSKKIAVFGGTGATGLLFVQKALQHDHDLTLYARNPSKLPSELTSNPKLKVLPAALYTSDNM